VATISPRRALGPWIVLVLVVATIAAMTTDSPAPRRDRDAAPPTTETSTPSPVDDDDPRLFATDSPWNVPIGADPALDPRSDAQVAWLVSKPHPATVNLYEYGIPIWHASADTDRHVVPCTKPWGTCGLVGNEMPIPSDAHATEVIDDGVLVVLDLDAGLSYELYGAERTDGGWTAAWGGVLPLDGDGVGTAANSATGAAVSRVAGVVRVEELRVGRVDHALVFSTDNACRGEFRYPAAKTDGRSGRPDCLPEGARVQLDPSVDLGAMPELSNVERIIGRALQRYGAYAIDNGGNRMAFSFESPSGESDPYPALGIEDHDGLDRLPWGRLRVLASWDGT
jgi:hypothetical protein